ncbi:TonB-dependent receptor [Pedobacter aquatilis]|uniref:TonB-dependent receptor n=1 Tax=Pedobacter aquatilis TaxID=351343 RepID=UPI0025B37822|nr:TonB-dependent receptor [Pedobacter aquatilis]MDN3587398.1 TonB-dependent receptor [Pedobacter aquatilis]
MKNLITRLLLFSAVFVTLLAFKGDDDPFNAILKKLVDYNTKYPHEKVYLHLDKPYYAVGDDIWFKAYATNSNTKGLSSLSKIIYVELIDEKDSLKRQLKLPLMNGVSWGNIKIADSLMEGNYRIRAYTNYMRNFETDYFYDKTIKVGNSISNTVFTKTAYKFSKENNLNNINATIHFEDKNGMPYREDEISYEIQIDDKTQSKGKAKTDLNGDAKINFTSNQFNKQGKILARLQLPNKSKVLKVIPILSTSNQIDVQFLPESGVLLEDLPQKIAVKAINSTGRGENISGVVLDDNKKVVTTFQTAHLGMGNFITNVQPGKTYTALVKFKDGSEKEFKFPEIQKGHSISVDNTDDKILKVKILSSSDLINGAELKIIAQKNGSIFHVAKARINKQLVSTSIDKSKLPSGITQLTLFSGDNQPIAERLVFLNHKNNQLAIDVNADSVSASRKGKTVFNFNASDNSKAAIGSFSISVANISKIKPDENNESNILSNLLLTSDLAGYVENPNHYFLNDDEKTRQELDNLMLTQGWSRFVWKNVINDVAPKITYAAEQSAVISGIVKKGGKPVVGGKVMLMAKDSKAFVLDTITDAQGRFKFQNLLFKDSTRFVVQARTKSNEKNVNIILDNVPAQIITKNKNLADVEVNVNEVLMTYIKANDSYFDEMRRLGLMDKSIKLNEVTIAGKKNLAPNSSNYNGPGMADFVLGGDKMKNCPTWTCVWRQIPGIIARLDTPRLIRGSFGSTTLKQTPMLYVVDGIYPGSLEGLMPADIESIELLKTIAYTTIYGFDAGGGVLVITTRRGVDTPYIPEGIVNLKPKGITVSKVFYAPQYDKPEPLNIDDTRNTIYWNPEVITNDTGKGRFEFYNANEPGNYRMIIEGIDVSGRLARKVYTYSVK